MLTPCHVLLLALLPALRAPDPRDVVLTGTPRTVHLSDRTPLRSLRFAAETATTVTAPRLRLVDGARIAYPKNGQRANQAIVADLEMLGDATFVNDNPWTHEAHMLRVEGTITGTGTLIVDGAADGGVELRGDSTAVFAGAIRIDGGMLIARVAGAFGPRGTPVTMRGGKLFLPGTTLSQALAVERSATLWMGATVEIRGDVTIASGATLQIDTGGGNRTRILGRLTGDGGLLLRGGSRGDASAAATLGGDDANTLRGPIRAAFGTLALAKPDGVAAVAADLVLGGARPPAILRLEADEQIVDRARVTFEGPGPVTFDANGHRETLGPLTLRAEALLRCGAGTDVVRFAGSADEDWTGTLVIEGWRRDQDRIAFGGAGLTPAQIARLGFRDPDGESGLFGARTGDDGSLSPGERVRARPDAPFAIDAAADRARRTRYQSDGLRVLSGSATRLRAGDTLSFFGDSITWLGGFTGRIERALAAGSGTRELDLRVRNRGINGGGVRDLRDGSAGAARHGGVTSAAGNVPQAPFAEVLRADATTVAVLLIGINDVNWKATTDEEFEHALRALCVSAREANARLVLATLLLDGELPDGSNPDDPHIERLAAITRRLASEERATLVDLRSAVIAWLQNHNRRLRLDGTLAFERLGLLTYDGIHASPRGNDLVANLLADGVHRALRAR